jgi:hypothetical protein
MVSRDVRRNMTVSGRNDSASLGIYTMNPTIGGELRAMNAQDCGSAGDAR